VHHIVHALLILALASPFASAQVAGTLASHIEAGEALLGVMDMEELLRQSTEAMFRLQKEENPDLARFEDIMREFMAKALRWEDLNAEYLALYTDLFTEAELRELHASYQTPLGQRVTATMADLMIRSSAISQRRVQAVMPKMMQRIMERAADSEGP
jgi:uncharacterized protein